MVLGPVGRFPGSKEVASYVGLAPALHASADTHHLGQITKQGNPFLRVILVQAASVAIATTRISIVSTRPCIAAEVTPKRKWPSPESYSFACSSCFATASTMTSFAGADERRARCRPDPAPAE